jgi:hypothetical protein
MEVELDDSKKLHAGVGVSIRRRKARWHPDTDPLRARVLYQLAADGYEGRYGRRPVPRDLGKEFPASSAGARPWSTWNRLFRGKGLPRKLSAPQSVLMTKLVQVDLRAAQSVDWALWPLSSKEPLTISEVHAYMLDLPDGVGHMLIRRMPTGRYLRSPVHRLSEIEFLLNEQNLGGFMGLVALLREAELDQDLGIYMIANGALRLRMCVLRRELNNSKVAEDVCTFLEARFSEMHYFFRGAYECHPRESVNAPPVQTILVGDDFKAARAEFEAEWLYGPNWDEPLSPN